MKLIDRVDAFARRIERLVAGRAVSDPLYLTNRTIGQRIRAGVLMGAPILFVAGLIYLALDKQFDPPASAQRGAPTTAKGPTGEITAKVLANLDKDYTSEQSKDVDVLEAVVSRGAERTLSGKLRNRSDGAVRVADVVFDITDQEGSQLGGVSVRVENIPAKGTAGFRIALPQNTARNALVREVRSR